MSVYDRILAKQPDAAASVEAIRDNANKKLYSEVLGGFFGLVAVLKDGALMVEIFEKDLVPEANKVNPLRFMELVGIILTKTAGSDAVFKTAEERLAFLKKMNAPFMTEEDKEAEEKAKADVEMKDADGKDAEKKPAPPVSRAAAIGSEFALFFQFSLLETMKLPNANADPSALVQN